MIVVIVAIYIIPNCFRRIDEFMYANEDFLVLYAAGNDGRKGISGQCTMKNGICVGAISPEGVLKGFSGR